MTTQKEIDEMFIGILENISQICDKTTSGNVSHNIATIKYKCRDMLQFYKQYPVTLWHSVKAGELPQVGKVCMFGYQGKLHKGFMYKDGALHFDDEFSPMLDINDVNYWMEIPEVPTELEKE
jgi:hypothetical protein